MTSVFLRLVTTSDAEYEGMAAPRAAVATAGLFASLAPHIIMKTKMRVARFQVFARSPTASLAQKISLQGPTTQTLRFVADNMRLVHSLQIENCVSFGLRFRGCRLIALGRFVLRQGCRGEGERTQRHADAAAVARLALCSRCAASARRHADPRLHRPSGRARHRAAPAAALVEPAPRDPRHRTSGRQPAGGARQPAGGEPRLVGGHLRHQRPRTRGIHRQGGGTRMAGDRSERVRSTCRRQSASHASQCGSKAPRSRSRARRRRVA